MILGPRFIARLAHATLGGAVAVVGLGVLSDFKGAGGAGEAVAGLLFAVSAYIVARSFRMRVRLSDGKLVVCGLLWSRTIATSAVTEVTDFPAICWRDARDRRRWTPIISLMSTSRQLEFITRHNVEQVRQLRQWVKRQPR